MEKRIKELQSSAGRLPVLDGFTVPGDRPLSRFQRGYYQCATQVISTPSGGSTGTSQRNYYRLVHRSGGREIRLSGAAFQRPPGKRLPRPVAGGAGSTQRHPSLRMPGQKRVRRRRPTIKPAQPEPTISAPTPGDRSPIAKSRTRPPPVRHFTLGDPAGCRSHGFIGHPESDRRQTHRGAGKRSQCPGRDPP